MMKPTGASANSFCSHPFCVSTSELLRAEDSNKELINLRKRNDIKTKHKKIKTIENVIENQMLTNSTDSFQDTRFSIGSRQCDAIEKKSAVLNLVNFVDKVAVLGPNRLGESCSCTTSAVLRQHELRKRRHRPSSNNTCAKQRLGSNYTISKKRSCLLKTILNTKFTQSTPSQCTYNFKTIETNQEHEKNHFTLQPSKKQPTDCSAGAKEQVKINVQHQSDIEPKLEQVLRPKTDNLTKQDMNIKGPKKHQEISAINFCFSRLGSKSKDSVTDLISCDFSSKLYNSELTKRATLERPSDKIYRSNHNPDLNKTYNDVDIDNNFLMKSASSSTISGVIKTSKLNNYNKCIAVEAQANNTKRNEHEGSQNLYCTEKSFNYAPKTVLRQKYSWMNTTENDRRLLANELSSPYKVQKQVKKCELEWNLSLMGHKNNKDMDISVSNCASEDGWFPTKNFEKKLKRTELLKQQKKYKADIDVVFPTHNNLKHANLKELDINKNTLIKDNLHISSESESSIIVSMTEIQRLIKNNQVKVIGPEGRRMRFKNVDSESLSNIKRKADDTNTILKHKETCIINSNVTNYAEMPEQIIKDRGLKDNKLSPKSLAEGTGKSRSNLFNSIAKCFNSFTKKKKSIKNELVKISTPSLNQCQEMKTTKMCNSSKHNSSSKNHIDRNAEINILSKFDGHYTATATGDNGFVDFDENISQKHNRLKHKLKTYMSNFQLWKKHSNKFVQNTPTIHDNGMNIQVQNTVAMKATQAQYAGNLGKPYQSNTSNERIKFYHPDKELYKKTRSPVLYDILYNQPPPSRYNIKMMKQRKHYYDSFSFEQDQFSSSLSDTPSSSYNKYDRRLIHNKYDFAEDELIYKAIRTAIKHQVLKPQFKKSAFSSRRKYYKQSQRQHLSDNSFSQKIYAMNVHHKLKPYECEPGVCVPNVDECDPNECIKLINKRLKNRASAVTTSGSKSISSQGTGKPRKDARQGDYPPPARGQAAGTRAPGKQNVPSGVAYTRPAHKPPKKKQAVRVGSSFSFNLEFSKGKSGEVVRPKIPEEHKPSEIKKTEKKKKKKPAKTRKVAGQTEYKHKDSSTSTADTNKHGKLKRCFCTLKLQKKGNVDAKVAETNKRRDRRHLDPHECEPNVCIPGSCDPNECLKRIKLRDRGVNAEPIGAHTSSSGTSPAKPKRKRKKEDRVKEKNVIAPKELHKSDISPNKQAVKIGSTFSFSLEFYKNIAPPVVEIEPDEELRLEPIPVRAPPPQKIKGKKVGGPRSSATSMISEFGVDRGSEFGPRRRRKHKGDMYGLHDRGVESRLGPRSESRGTGTLRRCFCTLKLHKQGIIPAGQVKLVKHHGTASGKYKEEPDYYSKGANTGKLLPYECEPGFCIPGECDPYECYKRIQARYCRETGTTTGKRGKYPRSQSTATIYKDAQQGTKQPKQRASRGQGLHPDYRDVAQSIETMVEEPRFRPILRKTRQVVRLGSDFKFNIEFFKDKTEHKTECIEPKQRDRGFSVASAISRHDAKHKKAKGDKKASKKADKKTDKRQNQAVTKRRSSFKRSVPRKPSTISRKGKSKVICECPAVKQPVISKSGVTQAQSPDKRTGKSQLKAKRHAVGTSQDKHHGSTMTALKRCFCTLSLKNKTQTQTVYTSYLNKFDDPFHYMENRSIVDAITNRDDESSPKIYQYCNETETLLKEILEQHQLPSLYQKHSDPKKGENELPYINSQVFYDDYPLPRDRCSSVTGFLPYCKKSIYAMRVDANTCGPKTCKTKPCNLDSCTKKAKNKQEDTKTLNSTKSTAVGQLNVTNKKAKEYIKDKNNANRFLGMQRTASPSKYPKEYHDQSKVVEESRFKSINDPFRQAVHISSSFTLNLEFRRDKLPDDLRLPYDDIPEQKNRTESSVQTRRQRTHATEKSIGIGAGQIGYSPKASKLRKFGMNVVEMKNKNISCDLPFEPFTADAGVGTKYKHKVAPAGCDPMCDPNYCPCPPKKGSKTPRRRSRLHKRESVQIGSKISCNVEFFRDHTYSLGPYRKGAGQYSNKQPGININREAPRSQRNDWAGGQPQSQVGSASVRTKESGVGPALKRCFCTLKFQKQIVNYLSVDTKSPLKLQNTRFTESIRCHSHSKHSLQTKSRSKQSLQAHMVKNNIRDEHFCRNTTIKSLSKKQIKHSEMETLYPYIPNKFNKTSKTLLRNEKKKHKLLDKDYIKHHKRNNRRQHKTHEKSQNFFFDMKKMFHAHNFFLALKQQFFKRPTQNVNISKPKKNKQTHRKKKPSKSPSGDITKDPKNAYLSRKKHKNYDRKNLKVSNSDRRPIKSRISHYPKKSKSSRPTIVEMRKIRKKGISEQQKKKYSRYQSGDAEEYIRKIKNRDNVSSHYETISESLQTQIKSKLNPYMDKKLVYVSLVNQRTIENNPVTQIDEELHKGKEPYHEQRQSYKQDTKRLETKEVKPLFDMHLKAADMSLLNTDDIYDKVMQLKHNRNKDIRKNLKIMKQLHGEMCCCCVCKALKNQYKQEKLNSVKEDIKVDTPMVDKFNIKSRIQGLKNKPKSCVCKSKKCAIEFQKNQLEKLSRGKGISKGDVCVCGTKICKKEALKEALKKKLSTKDRSKYESLLESAREEQQIQLRNMYLKKLADDVIKDQEKLEKAEKDAAKRLKKLEKTNSIVLCTDALRDLIKYTGLTIFGAVRCLVRAIINPKRTYYKLRYPIDSKALEHWRPTSLAAMGGRMKTRVAYSPSCKRCVGGIESNRCMASVLTAIDGKRRKPKKEDPRTKLITTGNFGCSLFMSSLRKKPFLKVYYTCPWFYPHCVNMLKLWRNIGECLLFCVAVLVWSPCILCTELCRALMCCSMCTG